LSIYLSSKDRNAVLIILILASFFLGFWLFRDQIKRDLGTVKSSGQIPKGNEFVLLPGEKGIYEVEVPKPQATIESLSGKLPKLNAVINETTSPTPYFSKLIIRVPNENFEQVETLIRDLGNIKRSKLRPPLEETPSRDYESMIEMYKQLEEKYIANLERNISVTQVEMVQNNLEKVREKIRNLQEQAELAEMEKTWSKLKVFLIAGSQNGSGTVGLIKRGFNAAWKFLLGGIIGFLIILLALIPIYGIMKLFGIVLETIGIKSRTSKGYYSRRKKVRRKSSRSKEEKDEG
jgi:molybdopterin converting factor small subunit